MAQTATQAKWSALHAKAHAAGMAASDAAPPRPFVPEGLWGFAYVVVDSRGGFARWARAEGLAFVDRSAGGTSLFVRNGPTQSVERKYAYAEAYAAVLKEAGLKAGCYSRLD